MKNHSEPAGVVAAACGAPSVPPSRPLPNPGYWRVRLEFGQPQEAQVQYPLLDENKSSTVCSKPLETFRNDVILHKKNILNRLESLRRPQESPPSPPAKSWDPVRNHSKACQGAKIELCMST